MSSESKCCKLLIACVKDARKNSLDKNLRCIVENDYVRNKSIFESCSAHYKDIKSAFDELTALGENEPMGRAVGSLCGLCIADAIGHNFEFLPICDRVDIFGSYFEYPSTVPGGSIHKPLNQFKLRPGQWTDDASTSLCLADSLLSCGKLNGSDLRCWFWNWWNNGVNNAFRYDDSRVQSVGLGGNISASLFDVKRLAKAGQPIPHKFQARTEDAGNGSLMRLTPVAIRYHTDILKARSAAKESSFTTHPGRIAAEACAFMAHVIVRAIHRDDPSLSAGAFLDQCVAEYLNILDAQPEPHTLAIRYLRRLLVGQEGPGSTELCWNWRDNSLFLEDTSRNRGLSYNGYPVSAEYFGSYSLDGLAIALHAVYHTRTFNHAIVKTINFRGDADTTGAIAAQIAGAFYGVKAIDETWMSNMRMWDPQREIELRAMCLFTAGQHETEIYETSTFCSSSVRTREMESTVETVDDDGESDAVASLVSEVVGYDSELVHPQHLLAEDRIPEINSMIRVAGADAADTTAAKRKSAEDTERIGELPRRKADDNNDRSEENKCIIM